MRFGTIAGSAILALTMIAQLVGAAPVRHSASKPRVAAIERGPAASGNPEKIMRTVYAALAADKSAPSIRHTPRLTSLFAMDAREAGADGVNRIDFDWLANGQDSKITNVFITKRSVENAPMRQIIVVRFKNFGAQHENHYFFEKNPLNGQWQLDDARSIEAGGDGYVLSTILKYGHDGAEARAEKNGTDK